MVEVTPATMMVPCSYLLVCIYGAGYPENAEDMFYFKHPYRTGPPCRDCPPLYPLCQPNPFVGPEIHEVHAAQENTTTIIFGGLCCKHQDTRFRRCHNILINLHAFLLSLQTRGRCVLGLIHTLPSGCLEAVCSSTPSRVCTVPSSTSSATNSSRWMLSLSPMTLLTTTLGWAPLESPSWAKGPHSSSQLLMDLWGLERESNSMQGLLRSYIHQQGQADCSQSSIQPHSTPPLCDSTLVSVWSLLTRSWTLLSDLPRTTMLISTGTALDCHSMTPEELLVSTNEANPAS